MYEELQRKTRPKAPRCILAGGIKGLFGIVSPSKHGIIEAVIMTKRPTRPL